MMSRNNAFRRHGSCVQAGATLVEFVISLPMFVMLIFIIAELSLMYQAKLVVDLASLAAARTGAVSGGDPSRMKQAAVLALAPLYANAKDSELKDALPGAGKDMGLNVLIDGAPSVVEDDNGKVKVVVRGTTGFLTINDDGAENAGKDKPLLNYWADPSKQWTDPARVLDVDILSPNGAMVSDFGVKRKIKGKDEEEIVIPNDNLMYRKQDKRGDVNIQDANLLKIKLTYLYELKMPLTRYFFTPLMDANLTRRVFGKGDIREVEEKMQKDKEIAEILKNLEYRIPLVSYSTVRMQSDFRKSSLPK